jgi:hypothetical protein
VRASHLTAEEIDWSPVPEVPTPTRTPSQPRGRLSAALAVAAALFAGGILLVADPPGKSAPQPRGRLTVAQAWPGARRADIDPALPDGPLFTPQLFLDARTAIGTAPTPDGASTRLLLRAADGSLRELRRVPLDGNPQFGAFAAEGDDIVWTESADRQPGVLIWHALRSAGPARMLTADTGNAVFYGNQYDLVVADGRVYWTAAPGDDDKSTDIRSVALTGGPVQVRTEPGQWAMSRWPWLVDDTGGRLRNLATERDVQVASAGSGQATCGPVWCRVMVTDGNGLVRIDLMHPDGTERRPVAGSHAQAAVTDVAVLDRFEILAEPGPSSDLTGTAGLLVYDLATDRTVQVATNADGAYTGDGVLWWSTGDQDNTVWHTIDLRTA